MTRAVRFSASTSPFPRTAPAWRCSPGGFNLLPWRQREARLARRRRVVEWIAAALAGGAAVLAFAGWQAFEKMRLDSQRVEVERILSTLSAPLAEHASLLHAQNERRKAVASATRLSAPLVHLRDLLDALSFEPNDGVVLQQLRQRIGETELLATSRGDLASADWLKRLSAIRGVKGADVDDLHRATPHGGASAIAGAMNATSAMEFAARLRWDGPPASHNDHTPRSTAPAPHKSEQSGGAK